MTFIRGAEEKEPVAKAAGAGGREEARETQSLGQNASGPSYRCWVLAASQRTLLAIERQEGINLGRMLSPTCSNLIF